MCPVGHLHKVLVAGEKRPEKSGSLLNEPECCHVLILAEV